MVAIKARDAETFLQTPDSFARVFLLFGPDSGRTTERADALTKRLLGDGFQLVRLDGDAVVSDPSILYDEANGTALFEPVGVIRLREGQRGLASALKPLLESDFVAGTDPIVIIEAGDLKPSAPTRKLVEGSRAGAAIGSYADETRDLARLVTDMVSAAGMSIGSEARDHLVSRLGNDRGVSRSEIEKLIVYADGRPAIGIDDIDEICGDASMSLRENFIDAVAGRNAAIAVEAYYGLVAEGVAPIALVGQLIRHMSALHKASAIIEAGGAPDGAMKAFLPPPSFRRKPLISSQVRSWRPNAIAAVIKRIQSLEMSLRTRSDIADALVERLIFQICAVRR